MQIRKKSVGFIVFVILVLLIIVGGEFVRRDAESEWRNQASWTTSPYISVPQESPSTSYTNTFNAETGELGFHTDYCLLFGTQQVNANTVRFKCSFVSMQLFEAREKTVNFGLSPNIEFEYVKDISSLPSEFFKIQNARLDDFLRAGIDPIPVTLTLKAYIKQPPKTIINVIAHYAKVKLLQKPESVEAKLLDWKVDDLQSVQTMSATSINKTVASWSTNTLTEIKLLLRSYKIQDKSGQEMLNTIRDAFQYQYSKCSSVEGSFRCEYWYPQNPADSLLWYLFVMGRDDPQDAIYKKILEATKTTLSPFLKKYNPQYVVAAQPQCPENDENCLTNYRIVNAYQYPVCPINDVVAMRNNTSAVSLFKDYVELANVVGIPTSVDSTVKYIDAIVLKSEPSRAGVADFKIAVELNTACYAILKLGIKDPAVLRSLESKYVMYLSSILDPGNKLKITRLSDFKKLVAAQQQKSIYRALPFIVDPSIAISRDVLQLESLDKQSSEATAWGSIPLSLAIIYLVD